MLKGAVTEGLQVFAQFSFFFFSLSLAHSKHCSGDQSLQMSCFPCKANPTGLVSQLNSSQGFANYQGEICQISHTSLEKKRKPQGSSPSTLGQGEFKKNELCPSVFPVLPFPISRQPSHGCQPSGGAAVQHLQMGIHSAWGTLLSLMKWKKQYKAVQYKDYKWLAPFPQETASSPTLPINPLLQMFPSCFLSGPETWGNSACS